MLVVYFGYITCVCVYFVKENSSSNRFLFGEFELSFLGLCLQSKSSVYIMYLGRNHSVGKIGQKWQKSAKNDEFRNDSTRKKVVV